MPICFQCHLSLLFCSTSYLCRTLCALWMSWILFHLKNLCCCSFCCFAAEDVTLLTGASSHPFLYKYISLPVSPKCTYPPPLALCHGCCLSRLLPSILSSRTVHSHGVPHLSVSSGWGSVWHMVQSIFVEPVSKSSGYSVISGFHFLSSSKQGCHTHILAHATWSN